MLGQYLIAFREVLEAALIVSIVLAYLVRTGRKSLSNYVWYGVLSATVASIILGSSILLFYGTLPESVEALFEGAAALIAVAVLSLMISWMSTKSRKLKEEVERRVEAISTRGAALGLVSFAFIAVFREGVETVLFLTPFLATDTISTIAGMLMGALTSLALAYGVYALGMKVNMRRFFCLTSVLLVLLAGGLAGYGVHELIEYYGSASIGWLGGNAYDLGLPSTSILYHKGIVGSIFAVMFGYTARAEWLRIIVHFAYLSFVLPIVIWTYKNSGDARG